MSNSSNNAPSVKWTTVAHVTAVHRQRLLLNGKETPYFVDDSRGVAAFRAQGDRYGLWGAGMHKSGCALLLRSAGKISVLKHAAEQFALDRVAA
jgi:hypothetical protein